MSDPATSDRRDLRFESLEAVLADVEGMDPSRVRATGAWTPAQNVQHIADAIDRSIDGFGVVAPDEIRARAAERKPAILAEGIPPGIELPEGMTHLLPDTDASWDDAIGELRRAIARTGPEHMSADHPFMGAMTEDEWRTLHCRHAELHFGFLHCDEA